MDVNTPALLPSAVKVIPIVCRKSRCRGCVISHFFKKCLSILIKTALKIIKYQKYLNINVQIKGNALRAVAGGVGFTNHDLYGVHNQSIFGLYMQGGNMFALLWY